MKGDQVGRASASEPDGDGLGRSLSEAGAWLVLVLVLGLLTGACARDGGASSLTPNRATFEAVCRAAAAARGDHAADASDAFAEVHQALHGLADRATSTDRATAARLLEAKQRVEADLQATPPSPTLATDLAGLVSAVAAASAAIGEAMASSCP